MPVKIEQNSAIIEISPNLYSTNAVLRAAYRMQEEYSIIVDGDGIEKIIVSLKRRDNKKICDDDIELFFTELLQAELEERNLRKFGNLNNIIENLLMKNDNIDFSSVDENETK